jgi:hypothetical protein
MPVAYTQRRLSPQLQSPTAPLPTPPVRNEHKLAVGHFVSAARITDFELSMLYARVSTPALSTRPDFPLPAGRGGQVSKYKSTTR